MKYKEFKKAIKNSYTTERQAIYENLKQIMDIPDDTAAVQSSAVARKAESKWRVFLKKPARLAACVSAAVAIVCIAIMLPFTLNNRSGLPAVTPPSVSDSPTTPEDRFCVATACQQIELKYSLKEYSARHNLSLLYVDWYDVADIKTSMYVNQENSFDIIYYQEIFEHKYTGSIAELYITDLRTHVDELDDYKKSCKNIYNVYVEKYSKVQVFWGVGSIKQWAPHVYEAWFKYGNYIYVLVLRYPVNENSIFELIDSMLPAIKR
ncbi:MAG: hypothetical protein J1F61_06530 [Clostridiales bacterium]|nr:hypothetical protein [Clostridiales bacterium]